MFHIFNVINFDLWESSFSKTWYSRDNNIRKSSFFGIVTHGENGSPKVLNTWHNVIQQKVKKPIGCSIFMLIANVERSGNKRYEVSYLKYRLARASDRER